MKNTDKTGDNDHSIRVGIKKVVQLSLPLH